MAKILIADDNQTMRYYLQQTLAGAGHDVCEVKNGKELVDQFNRDTPDLVITDVQMPVLDGFDAVRELRSREGTAHIPIIFISATFLELKSKLEGLDLGGNDYLAAPIEEEELLAKVGTLLRVKGLYEELAAAKTTIEESKDYTDSIIRSMANMLLVVSPDGDIVRVNDATCAALGYAEEELIGCPAAHLFEEEEEEEEEEDIAELILSKDTLPFKRTVLRRLVREGSVNDIERSLLTKTGDTIPVLISGSVMRDDQGKIRGIVCLALDITERKRLESEAHEAQEALLEQQRSEKERVEVELEEVRDELVRKTRLATIGQVSGSIAHELRNPLGSVRNAAYYLKRHAPKDQPKTTQFLEIIETQVARADKIISSLMEMTRGKELAAASIDLRKMVEEVLDHLEDGDGIRCTMTTDPDPYLFHADPELFERVVTNLITNAAEAMTGDGALVVEASRNDRANIIIFRDSGPGVVPDVRDSLFEPLVTTKTTGTGLGLSICRQIIERHGGTIEVTDDDKPGAAFQVTLPRGRDQEEQNT